MLERDNERKIILGAQAGDRIAREQLARMVRDRAAILIKRRWRISKDPDDLIQIVADEVDRSIVVSKKEVKSLAGLIYTVAYRRWVDKIREEQRGGKTISTGDPESNQKIPELKSAEQSSHRILQKELRELLIHELGRLSERHRSVVRLRNFEGLAFWEIADAFNVNVAKVKGWHYHALRVLGGSRRLQKVAGELFQGRTFGF